MSTFSKLIDAIDRKKIVTYDGSSEPAWANDRDWLLPSFDFGYEFDLAQVSTPNRNRLLEEVRKLQAKGNLFLPHPACIFVFRRPAPNRVDTASFLRLEEAGSYIGVESVEWFSIHPDLFYESDFKITIKKEHIKGHPLGLTYSGSPAPDIDEKRVRISAIILAEQVAMAAAAILLSRKAAARTEAPGQHSPKAIEAQSSVIGASEPGGRKPTALNVSLREVMRTATVSSNLSGTRKTAHVRRQHLRFIAKRGIYVPVRSTSVNGGGPAQEYEVRIKEA